MSDFYGGDPPWIRSPNWYRERAGLPKPPAQTAPPFTYVPDGSDFWGTELGIMLNEHGVLVFMDERKNFKVQGDGVRLHLPFDWVVMVDEHDLVTFILTGIRVSRENRERLGY